MVPGPVLLSPDSQHRPLLPDKMRLRLRSEFGFLLIVVSYTRIVQDEDPSSILVLTLSKKYELNGPAHPRTKLMAQKCAGFDAFSSYWQSSVSTLILFVPATVGHSRRGTNTCFVLDLPFLYPLPGLSLLAFVFFWLFPLFLWQLSQCPTKWENFRNLENKTNKTSAYTERLRVLISLKNASPFPVHAVLSKEHCNRVCLKEGCTFVDRCYIEEWCHASYAALAKIPCDTLYVDIHPSTFFALVQRNVAFGHQDRCYI